MSLMGLKIKVKHTIVLSVITFWPLYFHILNMILFRVFFGMDTFKGTSFQIFFPKPQNILPNIYLFKVNNRSIRKSYEMVES